jgi:hypothetical protein
MQQANKVMIDEEMAGNTQALTTSKLEGHNTYMKMC